MAQVKVVIAGVGLAITTTPIEEIDRRIKSHSHLFLDSAGLPGQQFRVRAESIHAYWSVVEVEDTVEVPDAPPEWLNGDA